MENEYYLEVKSGEMYLHADGVIVWVMNQDEAFRIINTQNANIPSYRDYPNGTKIHNTINCHFRYSINKLKEEARIYGIPIEAPPSQPSEQKQLSSGDQFPPFRKFTFENSDQSTIATDNTLPPEDVSKGAEEVLKKHCSPPAFNSNHISVLSAISAMQEYAQQSRQQARSEAIQQCIEVVERELEDTDDHAGYVACDNVVNKLKEKLKSRQ